MGIRQPFAGVADASVLRERNSNGRIDPVMTGDTR
jgi:hypothetical protein